MTYVLSSASACHLPERSAIPFDAMKTEFSSANIHITCRSLCWALWAHSGLCPLGRQTLRSGPGHSDEDYLHMKFCQVRGSNCLVVAASIPNT